MIPAAALLVSAAIRLGLGFLPPLTGGDSAAHVYGEMIFRQLLVWGLPALLMTRCYARRELWTCRAMDIPASLLAGGAAQYALSGVTAALQSMLCSEPDMIDLPGDALTWTLAALALVIVPAVTEELFFRGGLTRSLLGTRGGPWAAAAIFAAMHGSLTGLPAYAGVGALLTLSLLGTGRILPGMLLHMAYNGFALFWAVRPVARTWPGMILAAALIGLFVGRMIRRRREAEAEPASLLPVILAAGAAVIPRLL